MSNRSAKTRAVLIGVSSLFASSLTVAEGLSFEAGIDYSTGKYGGSESTNVTYMPFSAKYESGPLTYKLTVPWLRVTGNGSVVPGGLGSSGPGSSGGVGAFGCAADNRRGASKPEDSGPCAGVTGTVPVGAGSSSRTTESGLGDVIAAATYNVIDNSATGLVLDVTGRIKFATADESKALGSGTEVSPRITQSEQCIGSRRNRKEREY